MSYNLSTLLDSLVTVIIRYHDSQTKKTVGNLLQNPHPKSEDFHQIARGIMAKDHWAETLKQHITNCTSSYNGRKTLLEFILEQVKTIREFTDKMENLPLAEFKQGSELCQELQKQLLQLFLDIQTLIKTTGEYKTSIDAHEYSMPGCARYMMGLCLSGDILSEELLTPFYRSCSQDVPNGEQMREGISELCNTFKNTQHTRALTEDHDRLTKENDRLTEENKHLQQCIRQLKTEKSHPNEKIHSKPSNLFFPHHYPFMMNFNAWTDMNKSEEDVEEENDLFPFTTPNNI